MKGLKIRKLAVAMAAASALVAGGAQGAQVTLDGSFFDITFDNALTGLFGTPKIDGNTVRWFPSGSPGFSAGTFDGGKGTGFANSTFALKVKADAGYSLTDVSVSEGGDYFFYFLDESEGNKVNLNRGVGASGQLRVNLATSSDTLIDPITVEGSFTSISLLGFKTKNWTAKAFVDLAGNHDEADVSIQNLLLAWADPTKFPAGAFIEKKEVFLTIGVIPEADTYAMLLAGIAMVGWVARRRLRGISGSV